MVNVVYNQNMRRMNMYVDDDLEGELRQAAALEGRSAAAIVRDALRRYLRERSHPEQPDPFRPLIGAFTAGPDDSALHHDRYLYGDDLDAERPD